MHKYAVFHIKITYYLFITPNQHITCHRNNFRKLRVSDVSARILARMSVSVSVSGSWNSSL